MKILFYITLLSLTLSSCNFSTTTKCAYEMNDNFIIVIPVTINGKTFQFAYDTGADKTVMSYRATKQLNISNIERRPCNPMKHDTAAPADSACFTNLDLYIQGTKISDCEVCLDKYGMIAPSILDYKGYDGVLGNQDIRKKNWLFDFENKCLMLADTTENLLPFAKGYDQILDLKINNNHSNLYIDMCLDDSTSQTFLFDTGRSKCIELNYEGDNYIYYSAFALKDSLIPYLTDRIYFRNQGVLLQALKINDIVIKGVAADLNLSNTVKENIISAPFLRRFEYMLYDSKEERICLFYSEKGYGYKGYEEKESIGRIVKDLTDKGEIESTKK
ncbi:MAG: retroviral-like aspartic protease family protein [Bacteroides sp.]|nr:retroviral-like aspartic protease family protein [Bacteroides sp.]